MWAVAVCQDLAQGGCPHGLSSHAPRWTVACHGEPPSVAVHYMVRPLLRGAVAWPPLGGGALSMRHGPAQSADHGARACTR